MAIPARTQEELHDSQSAAEGWRSQIPAKGLREYWYPAVLAKKVGKKRPVGVRLLGENLVFFRDQRGEIVALQDLCAHRGGKLSLGECHFPGTVTCPYHGWTYNAEGKVVAALIEGPNSRVPEAGIRVPVKPVKELRGIVWVWIGDGEPVPLEEDVPDEFVEPDALVLTDVRLWPINWRPLIENAIDGHAPYVHRKSVLAILFGMGPLGQRLMPQLTRGGKGISLSKGPPPPMQQDYPGLGRFPRRYLRKYWHWIFRRLKRRVMFANMPSTQEIVLPGFTRIYYLDHLYMRWGVPVDETSVRNFYWHVTWGSPLWKFWFTVRYYLFRRWAMNANFSNQDRRIVGAQDYSAPENPSWTDAIVLGWRKIVLQGYHVERVKRTHQGKSHA